MVASVSATELKRGTIKKQKCSKAALRFKHAWYVINDVQNSVTHSSAMEDYYALCMSEHFVCFWAQSTFR